MFGPLAKVQHSNEYRASTRRGSTSPSECFYTVCKESLSSITLQKLVHRTQNVLPKFLHDFLVESVLVVTEANPQFACECVAE